MPEQTACPFCGHTFREDECSVTCTRCSLFASGGCKKMRCPQCDYEMPAPARLPGAINKLIKRLRKK